MTSNHVDPLDFACPSCSAERGELCMTRTGKRAAAHHSARMAAAALAANPDVDERVRARWQRLVERARN